MFTITKEYHFSASHQLNGLAEDHPCSRLHGHNYTVIVKLQNEILPKSGFVEDYHAIDAVMEPIIEKLDHYHLNDVIAEWVTKANPTAENLAYYIYLLVRSTDIGDSLTSITVKETAKTAAEYSV